MTAHSSGLTAGDRVRFTSVGQLRDYDRSGVLVADPSGNWAQVRYDGDTEPSSVMVDTLTRLDPA